MSTLASHAKAVVANEMTDHHRQLLREFLASALYVDIVLFAALVAVPREDLPDDPHLVQTMLGTAIGLLFAHWFALRLASHASAEGGAAEEHAAQEAVWMLLGGVVPALVASIPFLISDGRRAQNVAIFVLAALPAVTGLAIGRL